MKHRFRRWRIALRKILRRIVFSQSSANSVAWGVALGLFIGLTPTVGFQMIIAALLATLLGANRLASVLSVWVSNPFTLAPIYYFNFRVGASFLPVERAAEVREHFALVAERVAEISVTDFPATMGAALGEMGRLGFDIIAALIVGSIVVGAVAVAVSYPVTLWTVNLVRRHRRARSIRRAEERLERLEREGHYSRTDTGSWKPVNGEAVPEQEKPEESPDEGETRRKPLGPIVSREGRGSPSDADDDSGSTPANGTRRGG